MEMASTRARQRNVRPRGAARREALLEAVLKIVAETGPDAVTHRRVADVAELPLASTTYWFDSKEHLLTAAFELAADRDIARLREFATETTSPQAGLEAAADTDPISLAVSAILEPCDPSPQASRGSLVASYALLLEAARRPALQEIARRWTDAYVDALGSLFAQTASADPRRDAELLLAVADGLLIEQLATGDTGDLAPRLRWLATTLVEAPA